MSVPEPPLLVTTRVLEFDETFEASCGEEQCTELLKQGYTQLD
eukprot:CAMPEP_0206163716 /NCGR_PEP_ID=MMETSP1474-20131121/11584_1 /ASSEMBLY_ACC=CAM_ASM_001110 /TAXON_ID=97495 /ORGANISM="Imantonia sp., Strain RCC918" /LENGTH=42 /DNA_ID= /DNA_START= /DNA_END= /DNA_ORIENTATION=